MEFAAALTQLSSAASSAPAIKTRLPHIPTEALPTHGYDQPAARPSSNQTSSKRTRPAPVGLIKTKTATTAVAQEADTSSTPSSSSSKRPCRSSTIAAAVRSPPPSPVDCQTHSAARSALAKYVFRSPPLSLSSSLSCSTQRTHLPAFTNSRQTRARAAAAEPASAPLPRAQERLALGAAAARARARDRQRASRASRARRAGAAAARAVVQDVGCCRSGSIAPALHTRTRH